MSGVISSIITNSSAAVAVESLNNINSQLQNVQNQVSTGYRVSSAVNDGAAYAVAQSVRGDVGALTTANQQLTSAQGLLGTTVSGLNSISNQVNTLQTTLVQLSDSSVTGNQRTQYIAQYKSELQNVQTAIQDSNYNGRTLIGNISGSNGTFGGVNIVKNEVGGSFALTSFSGSTLYHALSFTSTQLSGATTVAGFLTATGSFTTQSQSVGTALNTYGNLTNLVTNQASFNSSKIDALNTGLGSLVDANLSQESAKLQSLQIQQQLATSALSIANQSPSLLVKLFP
ncbi:MAG: flagellin [Rhodospirillales bacterium 20-60-12]|nr:MAG: flagellin [Rhodospirillales bacterium 20-60-12]HQT67120.1 flagellin [Acetobacteraceae bacterium]